MLIDPKRINRAQRATLDALGPGFKVVETNVSGVRVSSGSDHRIIAADGSQRRGQPKVAAARSRGRA